MLTMMFHPFFFGRMIVMENGLKLRDVKTRTTNPNPKQNRVQASLPNKTLGRLIRPSRTTSMYGREGVKLPIATVSPKE